MLSQGFGYDPDQPPIPILGRQFSNKQFQIYVSSVYGRDFGNVSYITTSLAPESTAARVRVESTGRSYTNMPPALGLYKKEDDRAQFIINPTESQIDDFNRNGNWSDAENIFPDGTSISNIQVQNGGSRYTNPTVIIKDRQGSGYGARAAATIEDGVVTAMTVIDGGTQYREPYIVLVEESGKYISLTNDIGVIRSIDVIDPGKDSQPSTAILPGVNITTRLIVTDVKDINGNPTDEFIPGSNVYQGTSTRKLVVAKVDSYQNNIQQITVSDVEGDFKNNERIYDSYGNNGIVQLEGEAESSDRDWETVICWILF